MRCWTPPAMLPWWLKKSIDNLAGIWLIQKRDNPFRPFDVVIPACAGMTVLPMETCTFYVRFRVTNDAVYPTH